MLVPFKGTLCVISRYPPGRNSWITYQILEQYISFMKIVKDHTRLVFADEKLMPDIYIFGTVRHKIVTGEIPSYHMNASSKNRYNTLTVVTLKKLMCATWSMLFSKNVQVPPFFTICTRSLRFFYIAKRGHICC